ncbi:hypothetical protein A2W14_04815 [Candidatus Gottesmanbacteria bacterium RBG_16_37_8]|uniref:DUF1573 domain-containing protein n=1 Tax=Candidatus Gottesmanbacteria bacterium RBG_16_37_8 TaxID=1798371 RepID=A0A1F5YUR3_9BACT|nr:MAG: hypothetical protein A2W14_04815 [Candidatus Gottesmanbacteria bacterium RBG_16_37_8]
MKYPYYQEATSKTFFSTDKIIFFIIGGLTVLALILIGFFSVQEQKQKKVANVATYVATDQEKPKAVTTGFFSDLGKMKVNEEKGAKFTIENSGSKPLQVFNITSSCGCTVGKVTIGGKTSPEFSMDSKSNWTGEIQPGQNAAVEVIYRPFVMPVKGEVTRDVYVSTNDPENKLLTFTVKADVQ